MGAVPRPKAPRKRSSDSAHDAAPNLPAGRGAFSVRRGAGGAAASTATLAAASLGVTLLWRSRVLTHVILGTRGQDLLKRWGPTEPLSPGCDRAGRRHPEHGCSILPPDV